MQHTSDSDYISSDGNSTWADTGSGSNVCSVGTTTAFIAITAGTYIDCLPRHDFKDFMRCLKEPREFTEFEHTEIFVTPRIPRAKEVLWRSGQPSGRRATGRTGRGAG